MYVAVEIILHFLSNTDVLSLSDARCVLDGKRYFPNGFVGFLAVKDTNMFNAKLQIHKALCCSVLPAACIHRAGL